jgi:hypothetical protein
MIKYLLNILVIFLMLSSFGFAKNDDVDLQKEYGPDLNKAPFFLRFNFYREYKKDWKDSFYPERRDFLTAYQEKSIAEQKKEKDEAKAQAQKERELQAKKKLAERIERARLKQEQEKEKAEKKAEEQKEKEFQQSVLAQQKELQNEQRQMEEERQQQGQ